MKTVAIVAACVVCVSCWADDGDSVKETGLALGSAPSFQTGVHFVNPAPGDTAPYAMVDDREELANPAVGKNPSGRDRRDYIRDGISGAAVVVVAPQFGPRTSHLEPVAGRPGHFKPMKRMTVDVQCARGINAVTVTVLKPDYSHPTELVLAAGESLVLAGNLDSSGRLRDPLMVAIDRQAGNVRHEALVMKIPPGIPSCP